MKLFAASLAGFAALLVANGAAPASPTRTTQYMYAPFFGGHVIPRLHVVRSRRGYCWTGSLADSGRVDAWRCFIGNVIHDPCFSDLVRKVKGYVVCASAGWSSRVVKIVLTRRLPLARANRPNEPFDRPPWSIRLAGGKGCTAFTGATGTIAGQGISYGCAGGGVLVGLPRRTKPAWTIGYAPSFKSRRATRVAITQAWW
jgi:hypothetical protein